MYLGRESCDTENKVQGRNRMRIFYSFWVGCIVLVKLEESRTMQHGKQRSPFLKVDVDHLVRDQSRRRRGCDKQCIW